MVSGVQAPAGRASSAAVGLGVRAGPQGDERDAAVGQFAQLRLGGHLGVEDQQCRVGSGDGAPVVGEGEYLVVLGGFGQIAPICQEFWDPERSPVT